MLLYLKYIKLMLEDDDYIDSVVNIIETQQVNAEFAVATNRR